MGALEQALQAWRAVLGPGRVDIDAAVLARYAASTAARPVMPLAVLRVASHEEVAAVVRTAGEFDMPLYPLSTGRNWGYGDACPSSPGQVIVDLAGMNRIIDVDATLAYAVIEPGVTQAQLSGYLAQRQLPLWMDCTGAGPDTSLVGNILERGFGHSPYGDRFRHMAGMRAVLANGETLHTGFGHFANALTRHLYPYGVGPALDGLLTQSNLAIVTQLGLWLMPKAEAVSHMIASLPVHADVARAVDALRPLRLDGTLRSVVHIGNDLRVLSGGMVFPHALAPGGPPLPDAVRAELRARAGIGHWTISAAMYGRHAQVAEAQRAVRRALAHLPARLRFIDDRKLAIGARVARLARWSAGGRRLAEQVALGRSLLNMNRGVPDGRFLAGAYWRRRGGWPAGFPAHANPALDGCGMIWLAPVLPLRGADLLAVHALAAPAFAAHGFDLFETYSMINERALGGVLTICFDQGDAAETERAHRCYHVAFDALVAAGYVPYRTGPLAMRQLDKGDDSYWRTVARIKQALDPGGLFAPGRYDGS